MGNGHLKFGRNCFSKMRMPQTIRLFRRSAVCYKRPPLKNQQESSSRSKEKINYCLRINFRKNDYNLAKNTTFLPRQSSLASLILVWRQQTIACWNRVTKESLFWPSNIGQEQLQKISMCWGQTDSSHVAVPALLVAACLALFSWPLVSSSHIIFSSFPLVLLLLLPACPVYLSCHTGRTVVLFALLRGAVT